MYNYSYPSYNTSTSDLSSFSTFSIIALIIAIAAAIVIYVVFMGKDNEKNLNNTTKKIYEFLHFKKLCIGEFLKIAYIFCAIFLTIFSFSLIKTSVGGFIILLVFGNILLRIGFEYSMMLYNMYIELKEINKKTK